MHPFDDYITVEFSLSQKAFHKQSVLNMVINNQSNAIKRKQTDYLVIGIFKTNEEADNFIKKHRDDLKDYSMYKDIEGKSVVN